MNRTDEYRALTETLNQPPLKLDFTLDRAFLRKKERAQKRRRAIFAPIGSLAGLLALFMLLVNTLPGFAFAAGRIPILKELVEFVSISPSLSAAVENEFVQPVGLEQTKGGITARVEYVIVDQKQLNIFFSLDSETYNNLEATPNIFFDKGDLAEPPGYGITSGSYGAANGELRKIVVDFSSGTMPDALTFILKVYDNGSRYEDNSAAPESTVEDAYFADDPGPPETIAEFSFSLSFDAKHTAKGEILALNQDFTIEGQRIILDSVETYPTTLRLNFSFDPNNTAWPAKLHFTLEDERGETFGVSSSGLVGYGSPLHTYVLESPYFSDSRHLSLRFTGADWLDKDRERVRLDLKNKTADWLPEGVTFSKAEKHEQGWLLHFLAECEDENHRQIWSWPYFDAEGREYSIDSFSTMVSTGPEASGSFDEIVLVLKDYHKDEVWLSPHTSRSSHLETPVSLKIK